MSKIEEKNSKIEENDREDYSEEPGNPKSEQRKQGLNKNKTDSKILRSEIKEKPKEEGMKDEVEENRKIDISRKNKKNRDKNRRRNQKAKSKQNNNCIHYLNQMMIVLCLNKC